MTLITRADLMRFAPHANGHIADAVVAAADGALPKWGIDTAPLLQMFMAQTSVESQGFSKLFESMAYSAERLTAVWPNRFPTIASAQPYAGNPEALATKVYGGRMGNTGPNDGWLCRGQGLLQTTGMDSFARLAKAMGVSVDQVRAMLTADATMLECAAATFVTWGCLPYADRGDVAGCTRVINGGLNGLADRQTAYALARKVWPTIAAPAPAIAKAEPTPPPAIAPIQQSSAVSTGPHITGQMPAAPATPARWSLGQWFATTFFKRTA